MRRTYDILIALVAAYIFITFPLYTGPAALAEYRAAFVTPLMFSLYLFNRLGVTWLAARGVARLLARRQG